MEVWTGRCEGGRVAEPLARARFPHLLSLPPRRHRSGLERICCGPVSPRTSPPPFPGRWEGPVIGAGVGRGGDQKVLSQPAL